MLSKLCVTTSAQFVKFKAIGVDRTAQKVSRLLEWLCCTAAAGVAASAGGCAVCHQCSRKPIAFGCGAAVAGLAAYHYFVACGGAGVAATRCWLGCCCRCGSSGFVSAW